MNKLNCKINVTLIKNKLYLNSYNLPSLRSKSNVYTLWLLFNKTYILKKLVNSK